ncbi:hypothetical protein [Streptomyces apocyni]|uniref:hypothetical protein n=1 Tax=Streptomyces apocyni TaxID=2654677 RepID=UPI0018D121BD|nr:hypothetical protein [Streptomyces apocyni]
MTTGKTLVSVVGGTSAYRAYRAHRAFHDAARSGADFCTAGRAAADAAEARMRAIVPMRAIKGRASHLGRAASVTRTRVPLRPPRALSFLKFPQTSHIL